MAKPKNLPMMAMFFTPARDDGRIVEIGIYVFQNADDIRFLLTKCKHPFILLIETKA
jgi:hypothetical protein